MANDLLPIRNFTIIAHIDHGKSTLADRMLEKTQTIEKRKMKDQVLDVMDLERERGITIKMQPVRMEHEFENKKYVLNLIDTPGHIDFSYEVSRALKAVEGAILLVDATQGVQAQTLSVLDLAREQGLEIIPVLTKIDSPNARIEQVAEDVSKLINISRDEIFLVSGRTGEGVSELLDSIVERVPAPNAGESVGRRALVFDFEYSTHKGVLVYVRVFDGSFQKGDQLLFVASKEKFKLLEAGTFSPVPTPRKSLSAGEIGYFETGIKKANIASVGDTIIGEKDSLPALLGYMVPKPVVWASIFSEGDTGGDQFLMLKNALEQLKLSDPSISFEEETSGIMGRGFRVGFLGMLHLEIITERLKREFGLNIIVATPSILYEVEKNNGENITVYSPATFPDHGTYSRVLEPWVTAQIMSPSEYMGNILQLLYEHEGELESSESFSNDRVNLIVHMPLRELMRSFFDELKSASSGFASFSYDITDKREASVTRLDVLVAEEVVPAFSRIVPLHRVEEEAKEAVERLYKFFPKQLFVVKIQAKALGRIISSKTVSALRKDVTAKLYGGDVTRKRKLLEKQKKGKKKMQQGGKVHIPQDVFLKMMKGKD